MEKYDFSGWVTRNNIKCSDGRTICQDAFKDDDHKEVPLVWNHNHDNPENVLGKVILENRPEGVYGYGFFNETNSAKQAKALVEHKDVNSLSICANNLKQNGGKVLHGKIREVSLVLAGANPGAFIDTVIRHGEEMEDEAVIYNDEEISLYHADEENEETKSKSNSNNSGEVKSKSNKSNSEETVADVFDTLSEKQKNVVYAIIGAALEDAANEEDESEGGSKEMKHNVFDVNDKNEDTLMHAEQLGTILKDAKRYGSLKESFLAHADDYGIESIDFLFPDAKSVTPTPEFIKRDTGWVSDFMGAVGRTPFARIKSVFADITEDAARAKGYFKGKMKKDEVFSLLKRTTDPTTVYKKQRMDRDDVIDITDFDVVSWIKGEMRLMLDEEIARAALIGDGRLASDDDHINTNNIRPIVSDADLYTIKTTVSVASTATEDDVAKAFIRAAIKARKDYKGSGNPVLYTTEDFLNNMLLLTDEMGRDLYDSVEKLAKKLRVSRIVTVEVMEGLQNTSGKDVVGIIVNPIDYRIGADNGGSINMFDDFDIDYNQQKYLIETRCSGALVKPYSAIALSVSKDA